MNASIAHSQAGSGSSSGFNLLKLQRRALDIFGWGYTGFAFLLLAGAMIWILEVVFVRGVESLSWATFTTITQGSGGGLLNAIEGTVVLSIGGMVLAIPFGVAAGIYVAEFGHTRWSQVIKFLSDILVGVPSIVVGYAGYVIFVEELGWQFSAAAGAIALAIIALPYICRTTELALKEVPSGLREAGYALGARDRSVIFSITLPSALPGVVTGILLALSISVGETAPLLYTAGWSNYLWNGHLTHSPIGYLTYAIWAFINEPFASANALAYAAAFLVTMIVLLINIVARVLIARYQRRLR